ncbi:oligosaccharide repeat unit polymerase [Empedobacter falsenii]
MIYKVFLYIILFCYIYPIYLKFFPIPTDRIIQIFGFGLILFDLPYRKLVFKIKNLYIFYLTSLIFLVLIFLIQNWNYDEIDLYFFKNHLDIFLYFFPAYLIVYLLYKIDKNKILPNLFDTLILISVFQSIVSLMFFFIPSLFEFYTNLLSSNASQGLLTRLGQIEKRLMGIGSAFFTGVIKYSIPFFLLILLPNLKTDLYKNKKLYILSFILVTVGGLMTGRTFFIAIFLGLLLYILFDLKNAFRLIYKVIPIIIILAFIVYGLMFSLGNEQKLERAFNFVFELFINYKESGEITSNSSTGTLNMYKFPTNTKTWLVGDGKMLMPNGSYYMGSDVGYVRLIFYFGIVLTVLYFIYQIFLLVLIKSKTKNKEIRKFMLVMLLWLFILNFKGLTNFNDYFILIFLAFGVSNQVYIKHERK